MKTSVLVQTLCATTGTVLAGPVGGITGSLIGRLLPGVWPVAADLIESFVTTLTGDAVKAGTGAASDEINRRISPAEKQRINHDLQTAFRDAFREALYDIGGAACFPQAWGQKGRDVPPEVVYPLRPSAAKLWRDRDPLAEQICDCLRGLDKAWSGGRLLPLEPPVDRAAVSVYSYLETDQPQALADAFFEQAVAPHLSAPASLLAELPDLQPHLRRFLMDRTLVHLGENLKKRPEAWRAFNRLMLEGLRAQVGRLAQGQATVLARLDELAQPPAGSGMDAWADSMADLISATGRIERRLDEGFDSVLQRVTAQHRQEIHLLNRILAAIKEIAPPSSPQPRKRVVNTPVRPDMRATFRDRTAETAWLRSRLADSDVRLISVVGRGGYGKTALVSRVMIEAESGSLSLDGGSLPVAGVAYFSPGRTGLTLDRLYADLRALLGEPSAALLGHRWQDPAATIEQKACFLIEQMVHAVQEDEVLLVVLDGMEAALDEAGQVADSGLRLWLEACLESGGPIRLIVTSRQDVPVPDEAVPYVRGYNLESGLEESDGVQLLRDLDPEGRYRLRDAGEALLAQAVRQAGGVPFALTKIAGLLRRDPRLSLDTLLGDATIFGREITRSLAERCLGHLSPGERQVMEVLAVLEEPVTAAMVGRLTGNEGAAEEPVLDELARSYFVAYAPEDGTWTLQDVDAHLVRARLGPEEEAALHKSAGELWEVSDEVGDRLKAARHFQRAGEHGRAVPLAAGNVHACINAFLATDLRAVLESFTAQQLPIERWVEVLLGRGELYDFLGEGDAALTSYREGLAQQEMLPDSPQSRQRIARACRGIARLLERESPDQALDWLRRGLDELAEAGGLEEALSRLQMGSLLIAKDEYATAVKALRQTLELVPAGASDVRARALNNLGVAYCCQGDLVQGGEYYQ
ncbi:MAG: hypothetical protein JXM73_19390 [Anaerolineae bacterium]|nr:hypothetical protein [Anaerolineae bacterium]